MRSKRKQPGDRASWRLKAGAIFALLFLHVPIVVIILYAFTTDERTFRFPPPGLTTKWFETVIISRPDFWTSLVLSLQVAAIATGAGIKLPLGRLRFCAHGSCSQYSTSRGEAS